MAEVAGVVFAGATVMLGIYQALTKRTESSNGLEIRPTFDEAIEELCAVRDDREHKYRESRERMERTNVYNTWVKRVKKLEEEAKKLTDEHEKIKDRPEMLKHRPFTTLPKRMKKNTFAALRLYKQVIDVMLVESPPERAVKMYAPSVAEYRTLQDSLNLILQYLKDNRCNCVRVHGELGVGKTVIMKNLNNHVDVDVETFDLVIWVEVSDNGKKNFSTRKMQEVIANRLKLNMEGREDFADRIREKLNQKKCLLLLDAVIGDLDLEEIGIHPSDDDLGSKIVLTCRNAQDGPAMLKYQGVKIGRLSEPEAEKMFREILGHSRNHRYMQDVIDYCSSLPYLIAKTAIAFRNKDTNELWELGWNSLTYFRNQDDKAITKMNNHIKLFCNRLEGSDSLCFLYSALYPGGSGINTNCLLDCWTAEKFCGTRMVARQILSNLKEEHYLVEDECERGEYVRMEKYLWTVALDILLADAKHKHLVKNVGSSPNWPSMEDWNQKDRISLVDSNLTVLPECPDSPKLSSLFLQKNRSLKIVPTAFFKKMGNLQVLNLQNTGIVSIPSSLEQLKDLKVFYLNGCTSLLKLPVETGKLESLEVLDVRGVRVKITQEPPLFQKIINMLFGESNSSPLAAFPNIRCLSCLKRLLVSFDKENFSQNVSDFCKVISNITTLEELVIEVNSNKEDCNSEINVVRDTVATMTELTLLKFIFSDGAEEVINVVLDNKKIYFPKASDLQNFLDEPFEVYIGCSISPEQTPEIGKYKKYMKICNAQGCNGPTPNITRLLSRCNAFELVNDGDLEHLSQFGVGSFNEVEGCLIEGCTNFEAIADGADPTISASPMLPELLELYMKKLPLLESIWKGPWNAGSLVKLKTLLIKECFEIKELHADSGISAQLQNLSKLILTNLQNLEKICAIRNCTWPTLEELSIQGCPSLIELPFEEENAVKLKKLILVNLPSLTISATALVKWPFVEELQMDGCDLISELPFTKDSTMRLKKLTLINMQRLGALTRAGTSAWPALEELEIKDCPHLIRLSFNLKTALKLRSIKASQRWWEEQVRHDPNVKARLQQFFHPL